MLGIAKKIFGTENDRKLKKLRPLVEKINSLEPEFEKLTDDALRQKTEEFKKRFKDGETLDDLLPETFATVREAAKRTLGQRHYDVQLIGGITLHRGEIAEMRTGEGKTLVSTLAAYLNALPGEGVHIITVNDYLARRDSEWMGQVYKFLGMSVGCINDHDAYGNERKDAYDCDITYGTNNEYGFDYLRDNMKYSIEEMAQRGHNYAIIDEIDSVLIDEARTPLIISGPTDDKSEFYRTIDTIIPAITEDGYDIDEKARTATFNEAGNEQIENILKDSGMLEGESLYDVENVTIVHHINQALKAHKIFYRDKDYIVKNNEVVLIDEFTGRMMDGRRLSEGLHQAIEAKENVEVKPENVTLASVTLQNYFRLYEKLSGMTGTAETEASEFFDIYKLEVLVIPTNRPIQRIDDQDEIYRTEREKFNIIIDEIIECKKKGQPVLVGTVSIEKSESLARVLVERGIEHKVLNARFHEEEAAIVALAGVPGAVTIATNMAGRGTDIQLGGSVELEVVKSLAEDDDEAKIAQKRVEAEKAVADLKQQALDAGGLFVLATERHESRRIDNQLRGRSGRQGDPGTTKFFLSLEDDLMRIFGSGMEKMLKRFGIQPDESIEHPWFTKAVETAQKKVEQRNFDIRKNVLKFDDVKNDQRKAIFDQRIEFMSADTVDEIIDEMREQLIEDQVAQFIPAKSYAEQWDMDGLTSELEEIYGQSFNIKSRAEEEGVADTEIIEHLTEEVKKIAATKAAEVGPDTMRQAEKAILLHVLDTNWREHLQQLDHLQSVVGLRGYGQRDPVNEFKTEAFALFETLLNTLRRDVVQMLTRAQFRSPEEMVPERPDIPMTEMHENPLTGENEMEDRRLNPIAQESAGHSTLRGRRSSQEINPNDPSSWGRVSRNAPCPCGSGRKYKHCHGTI